MTHADFWQNWLYGWIKSRNITQMDIVPNGYLFHIGDGRREKELLLVSPENIDDAVALLSPKDYLCVCHVDTNFTPPPGWQHSLYADMMINLNLTPQAVDFPPDFTLIRQEDDDVLALQILASDGELVCCGQVGYYGDYVIFDRIETLPAYQRQGWATKLMYLLTLDAAQRGIHQGLLCASEQGKSLYQTLGWQSIGRYSRLLHENYSRD